MNTFNKNICVNFKPLNIHIANKHLKHTGKRKKTEKTQRMKIINVIIRMKK